MFKLPENIKRGIADYKKSLDDFLKGRMNSARFTGIRVPWGIYSHRGGRLFMSRIRIPAGIVTPEQLKAIAHVAKIYGKGLAHITTRQDIQVHDVKIEDTAKAIEYLKDYDLSSRGGGGNTVRNITACVLSGICKDELFDVRPYAVAVAEQLLNQDASYNMPRKLKMTFSACDKDCGGCLVNDVGFASRIKDGKIGFAVFAGGGMGSQPRLGRLLEDFVPAEEAGYYATAIREVFYKNGDRRNKHHNRLRFLIEDIGFDKFRKLYDDELKGLKENEYIFLRKIEYPSPEFPDANIPSSRDGQFNEFLAYSVTGQKQKGASAVELRIPRGDVTARALESLAGLAKEFTGIEFRTSKTQNLFICNAKNTEVEPLFLKLKGILKDFLYPSTVMDVVSCKGALTCNLGLCNSPGLAEILEDILACFKGTPLFKKIDVKINGCPNSCGQHPVGAIALHAVVRRVQGRPVPFYKLLLGGRVDLENTRLAKDTGLLIPARSVPQFLKDFLGRIAKDISADTDIYKYLDEKGSSAAAEAASKYSYVPAYSENKDFYIDWGRIEEFSLDGLGPGECGAGVIDMIEADLAEAARSLAKSSRKKYSADEIRQALFLSARALLVVRGMDPKDEAHALSLFIEKFVKEGIAPAKYADLSEGPKSFSYAADFLETVKALYKTMDPSFNFPKAAEIAAAPQGPKKENRVYDLKGTPCPMNYVKAKLFLENLGLGDVVDIFLDEGEPVNNVPKSLQADGQEILNIEKLDGFYKVTVKKLK